MSQADDFWDPEPSDRVYYRARQDGQRGYIVRRDKIRLDRPMEELIREFTNDWAPDNQTYPVTEHAIARIAFVADRALCGAIGKHDVARDNEWLSLSDKARQKWMKEGPSSGDVRDDLFDAIMGTLRPLSNG
jgi:hypothetical protein